MITLTYTDHAVQRMAQRNITDELVKLIIGKPDGVIKQSFDKVIYYKKVQKRSDNLLGVVLVSDKEVLTVMNYFEVLK